MTPTSTGVGFLIFSWAVSRLSGGLAPSFLNACSMRHKWGSRKEDNVNEALLQCSASPWRTWVVA